MLIEVPMLIIPWKIVQRYIGKYFAKNGPARAPRHLSVPETIVRSVLGKSVKY